MIKQIAMIIIITMAILVAGCAPSTSEVPAVDAETIECLETFPRVTWSEEASYSSEARYNRSGAHISFFKSDAGMTAVITKIEVASSAKGTPREQIHIKKEICGTAYGIQIAIEKFICGDGRDLCITTDADSFYLFIDALGIAYLNLEEQETMFAHAGISTLQLEEGTDPLSCSYVEAFEEWSEKELIKSGDWSALKSICTPD